MALWWDSLARCLASLKHNCVISSKLAQHQGEKVTVLKHCWGKNGPLLFPLCHLIGTYKLVFLVACLNPCATEALVRWLRLRGQRLECLCDPQSLSARLTCWKQILSFGTTYSCFREAQDSPRCCSPEEKTYIHCHLGQAFCKAQPSVSQVDPWLTCLLQCCSPGANTYIYCHLDLVERSQRLDALMLLTGSKYIYILSSWVCFTRLLRVHGVPGMSPDERPTQGQILGSLFGWF